VPERRHLLSLSIDSPHKPSVAMGIASHLFNAVGEGTHISPPGSVKKFEKFKDVIFTAAR
jgi:hypothetical protein